MRRPDIMAAMLKKLIITVCIEAVVLAGGAMIDPKILLANAAWIATGAIAILLLVAVYEWWTSQKEGPRAAGDANTANTNGDGSPAFAGSFPGATFNFHPPPPATQERKQALAPHRPARTQHPEPSPVLPDMELREVCDRLYNSLGGPVQLTADFEDRVDLEIKDNVRLRRLHTWGRRGPKEGLDDVWAEAWLRGDFSHKRGSLRYRHPDNLASLLEWSDLRFNRQEVDKWLPPPRQTRPRPNLGPNGWMAH